MSLVVNHDMHAKNAAFNSGTVNVYAGSTLTVGGADGTGRWVQKGGRLISGAVDMGGALELEG